MEILRLKGEASGFDAPEIQAYYAKNVAAKELLKIEQQRAAVNKELEVLRGASNKTPEEQYATRNKALQLSGQLNELDNNAMRVKVQLQQDLNSLTMQNIMLQAQRQQQREDELNAIEDLKRSSMYRANDIYDSLRYDRYALPEQGRYRRNMDQIQRREAEVTGRIAGSQVLDQLEKERATKEAILMFDKERIATQRQYQEEMDKSYNATRGAEDAMKDYTVSAKSAGVNAYNAVRQIADGLENTLTNAIIKGKLDFKSLTDFIISEVVRLQIVKPLLTNIFSGAGGGGGDGIGSIFANIFGGGGGGSSYVTPFAKGGVVTRPTMFPFAKGVMGEAEPEAIMPLGRDNQGRLGVRGGGGGNVQVNIINNAGASVTQTQRQQGDTTFIDVMVNQIEDRLAGNVAAGGGSLFHSIGNTFGMKRAVT
jgi:lambda family phage tail tape measure protein